MRHPDARSQANATFLPASLILLREPWQADKPSRSSSAGRILYEGQRTLWPMKMMSNCADMVSDRFPSRENVSVQMYKWF